MARESIKIEQVNQGGLAHSLYSGAKNSLYKLTGFDIHSVPGALLVRQKLAKSSGSTVTEFCKARVNCSNGEKYWFSSTSGKIWRCSSSDVWTLVYTTDITYATNGEWWFRNSGEPYTTDAYEYDGYIYWATEKAIHRIAVSAATGTWTGNVNLMYAPFFLDTQGTGGTGEAYTLQTSINEGATHRNTITFETDTITGFIIWVDTKGTGNWTLTLHDSVNASLGAVTVANASVTTITFFEFATPIKVIPGKSYHYHVTVSAGSSIMGVNANATAVGAGYLSYTTCESTYHPMREQNLVLYIGDGKYVHQIDREYDSTLSSEFLGLSGEFHKFSLRALDIPSPHRIKAIGKVATDILVGTIISNNVAKCAVFRWNTWSDSFTSQDEIDEVGVNSFLESDNIIIANAGIAGNLYVYNGEQMQLFKKIPGTYSSTQYGTIHPNAVGNLHGIILFGFSNGSGNPAEEGVYVLGRHSVDYPLVLDFSFPISERSSGELVTTGIEIGAILVSGFNVYVSWKNGSTYGVDKLDYSNKLESAYYETRLIVVDRDKITTFPSFNIGYQSLPASTSITQSVKKDHDAYVALSSVNDTTRKSYHSDDRVEATILQYKIQTTVSGNNAPVLEYVDIKVDK